MSNQTNGNGWVKWLVATLWGALVMVILFIGNTVRANDDKAIKEHTSIRKEIVSGDEKILDKLEDKVEKIQHDITEQKIAIAKILQAVEK